MGWSERRASVTLKSFERAVDVRRLSLMLIGGFVGILIVASSAQAGPIVFDNRAAWVAAAGSHRTFAQPDSLVIGNPNNSFVTSLEFGGITVGYDYAQITGWGSGWSTETFGFGTAFGIDENVRGFGFDFFGGFSGYAPIANPDNPDWPWAWVSYPAPVTLELSSPLEGRILHTYPLTNGGFFGILLDPGERLGYGYFQFDTSVCDYCESLYQDVNVDRLVVKTPEGGSTAMLLGLGLAALVLARRKRTARRA